MKITILGSGGGEAYPATFCGCEHCVAARRAGGKSIRTLSQTLINDDLLVDFPADTAEHARRHGLNLGDIGNILITHTHSDHFVPSVLFCRGGAYAHKMKCPTVNIYGSSDVGQVFRAADSAYGCNASVKGNIIINEVKAYETRAVGDYTVTAMPAKHAPKLTALNYIIEKDGKTLIYFHDTGYPTSEVLDFVENRGTHADCVLMDATMGAKNNYDYHMSFDDNKRLAAELKARAISDRSTVFVANHITHNQAGLHGEIEERFAGSGILVSYDGLVIEV